MQPFVLYILSFSSEYYGKSNDYNLQTAATKEIIVQKFLNRSITQKIKNVFLAGSFD